MDGYKTLHVAFLLHLYCSGRVNPITSPSSIKQNILTTLLILT